MPDALDALERIYIRGHRIDSFVRETARKDVTLHSPTSCRACSGKRITELAALAFECHIGHRKGNKDKEITTSCAVLFPPLPR
nr:hypothetical protein [Desulfobacterales bacterium]